MKRLVITAITAVAVLAASQGQARAHGYGFGFGFGIGISFSGSAWSSSSCAPCCGTACCKPSGPTCCGIPAGGVPGCGLAVAGPDWMCNFVGYGPYGYNPYHDPMALLAAAYQTHLANTYPGYYPGCGYPPAAAPQAGPGHAAVANAR